MNPPIEGFDEAMNKSSKLQHEVTTMLLDIIDKHYNWTEEMSLGKLAREAESHLVKIRNSALSKNVEANIVPEYGIGYHVDRAFMASMPN